MASRQPKGTQSNHAEATAVVDDERGHEGRKRFEESASFLFPAEDDEEAAGAIPIRCLHAERSAADSGRSAWTLLLSSSMVTSLRPGLREDARPRPRRWSLLCLWAVVRRVLHLLPGPGGGLLSPWGAVLLHLHLLFRTSTVVESRCQGHADGLLLVPKHRAQPPLTSSLSSADGLPA